MLEILHQLDLLLTAHARSVAAMSNLPTPPPIACSLGAGRQGQVERWRTLLQGVEPEAIDDGLQYRLPIELVESVVRVAADEQACCPFFAFDLALRGDTVVLAIRTPPEGASMLAEITERPKASAG